MTQALKSLQRTAASIRRADKLAVYKKQIAGLTDALVHQKEKVRAEEARAEMAERQVRQIAVERDLWKHQAQEAQAALKSMGNHWHKEHGPLASVPEGTMPDVPEPRDRWAYPIRSRSASGWRARILPGTLVRCGNAS